MIRHALQNGDHVTGLAFFELGRHRQRTPGQALSGLNQGPYRHPHAFETTTPSLSTLVQRSPLP